MASKLKRRRRVLGASCILAALIVGGSSFAWFTSKDEVVNRLSAKSDYGVGLAEDFTPPENWVPGQKIDKNVGVVNTGNVDAFVRVWLEGEFKLVAESDGPAANVGRYDPADITDNDKMKDLGFKKLTSGSDSYFVKPLSKDKDNNGKSEVQTMQSGGYLAFAPNGAKYQYTVNQDKNVDVYTSTTAHAVTKIRKGSVVQVGAVAAAPSGTKYTAPSNSAGDVDSATFMPTTTGLYLFRHNVDVDDGNNDKNWEYSGYYYVSSASEDGTWDNQGAYYALKTKTTTDGEKTAYADGICQNVTNTTGDVTWYIDRQTGAITDEAALVGAKLYAGAQTAVKDDEITWRYTEATPTAPAKLNATITTTSRDANKKISVDVGLTNIGTDANKWQYVAATNDTKRATFYYTNDVEDGSTTATLVDDVTLDKDTKQSAYIAFDFDLSVNMNSIQVTIDDDGNECFESVKDGWSADDSKAVAQKGDGTAAAEIATVTWSSVS